MRTSFLINRFLASRSHVFRYPDARRHGPDAYRAADLGRRFERRAARYDARRRVYFLGMQAGILAALLVVLSLSLAPLRLSGRTNTPTGQVVEAVVLEDIQQTRQVPKPPPPPAPPVPIEVPNDVDLEEDMLELDAEISFDEPLVVPPPPQRPETAEPVDEPEIFVVVSQMPEMIGGMEKLNNDIEYPMQARLADIEGTVVVQVVVDEEGRPTEPTILRAVHKLLDQAALDAIMKQRFTPGRQRDRAVKVRLSVPVRFRLRG